ncbi:IMP-specific 5-nucleotidase [Conidiobolus coronatus NRRL 28638]|uniref:IMP-specific 5'-nucleotidase 1 n=1 Tax=Conidiobolus coronatus (strain ATCC 28846 / CBS 209.66 / NRRL 28638) TaxID=796925 RepID=A0A137PBU2_CONC2|nr:IMP-specific 5-nucleotidase [Conidiobolus coronatus NRRL 28638]|eukprot:KXN72487.1 IMP-specific 5-nucleotidase [Conidiobolus coronatus NRRL 28638]
MTSLYRINYQLRAHKRDELIEFVKSMMMSPFVLYARPQYETLVDPDELSISKDKSADTNKTNYLNVLKSVEELVQEHREKVELESHSRLKRLVPNIGNFFTELPLTKAFEMIDNKHAIAARRFVPPSFNDIRRILNLAQVLAIAPQLKLITFDGDMTLYADGKDFEHNSNLVGLLIQLLRHNLNVAVVTAAGYGDETEKYEKRLSGLLKGFKESDLTPEQLERFYVFGGECNFLLQLKSNCKLVYIQETEYLPNGVRDWSDDDVVSFLNCAEKNLRRCIYSMNMPATVLRKTRACGIIPNEGVKISREQLDECVLSTQAHLFEKQNKYDHPSELKKNTRVNPKVAFCAFNGGSDVWVDVGNKSIGVQLLQRYLKAGPEHTLHVGDQFLSTGNDYATRAACCTNWIVNPEETETMLTHLVECWE